MRLMGSRRKICSFILQPTRLDQYPDTRRLRRLLMGMRRRRRGSRMGEGEEGSILDLERQLERVDGWERGED